MPAVAYALSRSFTPEYEAVSREIAALRRPDDPVVAVLPLRSNPLRNSLRDGVHTGHPLPLRFDGRLGGALRDASLLHVFAPVPMPRRMWSLVRRASCPTVLTVISLDEEDPSALSALNCFDSVIAECDHDLERLRAAGLDQSRKVHPGAFPLSVQPPHSSVPFTVLFASWPFELDEAHSRGLDLLAAAARQTPDVRWHLLTRPESKVGAEQFGFGENVVTDGRVQRDWPALWAEVHAVVAPFRAGSKSKSAPNSVIEGLSAARPAVLGAGVGLAGLLTDEGAALSCGPSPVELAEAVNELRAGYDRFVANARASFHRHFELDAFRASYAELYAALV